MDGENNALKPILKNGRHSDEPQIAREEVVVFRSDVTDVDGIARTGTIYYDRFNYKNGRTTRLLNARYRNISNFSISPDGLKAALLERTDDYPYVELSV